MERVRYCIDLTALKLQLQLIYGTTSVPRILKDILIFRRPFLIPACGLGDRSNSVKPVTYRPPQPHSLVPPDFFLYGERKGGFFGGGNSRITCMKPNVCPFWTSVVLMTIHGDMRTTVAVLHLLFTYIYLKCLTSVGICVWNWEYRGSYFTHLWKELAPKLI